MVDLFDRLYANLRDQNRFLTNIRFYSLCRIIIRFTANHLLPLYFTFTRNNKRYSLQPNSNKSNRIIVSLTSFPTRIERLWLVIESMLRQSVKPDLIVLWLSSEQFESINALPKRLLALRQRGLVIELRNGNLRSHKKYYYSLQQYPGDTIITIDDDIFYPSNTISELMEAHEKFPEAVIVRFAQKITRQGADLSLYLEWPLDYSQEVPDFATFFGTGGGALFPPHSLPSETLDQELFLRLCFHADDIWLNAMCRLNNRRILKTRTESCSLLPVINKNDKTLSTVNLDQGHNDIQLKKVRDYFKASIGFDPYLDPL